MSWQLPRAPLRDRALFLFVLGSGVMGTAAGVVQRAVDADPAFRLRALLVFMMIVGFALGQLRAHHPHEQVGAANVVTSVRAMLVSLVAALVGGPITSAAAAAAAGLGAVAIALDGVDGWLARRAGLSSPFGARFDMETDALLILVLSVLAWRHGKAGSWIVLAGALRYLFVAAGWLWQWMQAPLPESQRRKAVCVIQLGGLGIIVSPLVAAPASVVVGACTLALLAWSFLVDVLWLRRHRA